MPKAIKDLKKTNKDLEDKWKRALADYQNLEKRVSANQIDFIKFANSALLTKLLTILDSLDRANAHSQDQGITIIINQFKKLLESEGVKKIKTTNQTFDPLSMEAIEQVTGSKNKVIKTINSGYTLNNKILRPAQVAVGKGNSIK